MIHGAVAAVGRLAKDKEERYKPRFPGRVRWDVRVGIAHLPASSGFCRQGGTRT